MKNFLRIGILWIIGICLTSVVYGGLLTSERKSSFFGDLVASYEYGEYGPIATGAVMKNEETGRTIWAATLKEVRVEEQILVLEER